MTLSGVSKMASDNTGQTPRPEKQEERFLTGQRGRYPSGLMQSKAF